MTVHQLLVLVFNALVVAFGFALAYALNSFVSRKPCSCGHCTECHTRDGNL